jgi:hypothetical protein
VRPGAASILLSLCACADAADTSVGEDLDERACAFVGVSGMTLSAMTDMAADSLATIETSDEPWTITLPEGQPGWLRFELPEPAFLRLYVDQPGVAADLVLESNPMGLPYPVPVEACAQDIPEHFRLNLDQPGVYHLELAPTDGAQLWMMLMGVGDL